MNILLKHTLRSIKSNIGQFAVIIITVMVVTAMIFVAFSISDLFYNLNVSLDSRLGSQTDICLSGELYSSAKLDEFLAENKSKIAYNDNYLQIGALFKNENSNDKTSKLVMVEATDTKTIAKRYPNMLKVKEVLKGNYEYPSVWVGESFLEENNLNLGDEIEIYLEMFRTYQTMTITYVFENEGFFANSVVNNLMIDYASINAKGIYNLTYIKLNNADDYDKVAQSLYTFMNDDNLTVTKSVDYPKIERIVENNQLLLNVSLVFVIALMMFILFTSYLVIANNRLSEMIIFKAAGATPVQTTAILLTESLFYGITGAVLGVLFGRIGMGIAVRQVIPNFVSAVSYDFSDYALAVLSGIFISLAASLYPIMKISGEKIRQLTSGTNKIVKKISPLWLILITVLLAANIAVLIFVKEATIAATATLTVLVATFVALIMPYLINAISRLFTLGKGVHKIAGMSIKRNKSSRTLASLVGSIIVFTFLVVNIISIVQLAVVPISERFKADFVVQSVESSDYKNVREKIEHTAGVKDAFLINQIPCRWIMDTQSFEYSIYTVDNSTAIKSITHGVSDEVIAKFDSTLHPVIITYDMSERCGYGIGDKIKINLGTRESDKGYLDYEYEVVGIDYAKTKNDRIVIIPSGDVVSSGKSISADTAVILINAKEGTWTKDLYAALRQDLEKEYFYILTYEDWAYATSVGIKGIMQLLSILQIVVSSVALIGAVNLSVINILNRKNEFNIYISAGMDKKGFISVLLSESLIIGCSGAVLGFVISAFVNRLMPIFAKLIDRYMVLEVIPVLIPIITIIAVVIFTAIYLITALSKRTKYTYLRDINYR